jgi:Family of unknown function (DUF6527)
MKTFTHRFVEFVPETLEEKTLYVSLTYGTVSHRCACGCGREVVTPLTPTDWKLTFDGETISLHPSIGNWNFPCRSHYWIKKNRVKWAENWSEIQIRKELSEDRVMKDEYYQVSVPKNSDDGVNPKDAQNFWKRIKPLWWRW